MSEKAIVTYSNSDSGCPAAPPNVQGAQLPGLPPMVARSARVQRQTVPKVNWNALWPGQLQRLVRPHATAQPRKMPVGSDSTSFTRSLNW
jgi:hypothetical protein